MNTKIEDFVKSVINANTDEKNKFCSNINKYFQLLEEDLMHLPYGDIHRKLCDMREFIHYNSNGSIQSIKDRIIKDATYVDDLLAAHEQDWESIENKV